MKKNLIFICMAALICLLVTGCGSQEPAANNSEEQKLVVGCTAKPHAEILEVVKPLLEKENIDLEIKVFTDYVLLNPALNDGQIDANFFQHIPYLDEYNAQHNTKLVWTVKVHNEPMGIYSKKLQKFDELKENAVIGIPNDATNGGRALMVLEKAGVLQLKEGAGVTATEKDVINNSKNLKIQMMDAAMLPRALEDLDLCVINSNYALEAKLVPTKDALFMEPKDSPFANVLVVRPEDKTKEGIVKLGKALQSEEVKAFLEETYKGNCIPAF